MTRPIRATIVPSAIAHNLSVARQHAPQSKIWGIVKANAYGHGLTRIFPGLTEADGLGLLDFEEAIVARDLGWSKPILLLEGFFDESDLSLVDAYQLTTAVHDFAQIDMLGHLYPKRPVNIYLKINTGMNRLGFAPHQVARAWERLRALPAVGAITFMTHFANADRMETAVTDLDRQHAGTAMADALERFDAAVDGLPGEHSVANSAATLLHPATHRSWVRPGVMTYGASPCAGSSAASFGLKPVMHLESRIIAVQNIKTGDAVGYGSRFVADKPMRIGVVACGYADGYPRIAPTGTPVAVDGQRTRLVGRVSMDMLTVDLTDLPKAGVDSTVELWGSIIAVDEVAEAAGTIGYEMLCALAQRVPVVLA